MEKLHSSKYPSLEEDQFDLDRALLCLLNCRRYIHSQGFQELTGDNSNINGIAGNYAVIVFPDGSTVSDKNFKNTKNRDALLENMILEGVILNPDISLYNNYVRSRIVTSTFERDGYRVRFAIKDTTKKKLGFFRGIGHNAEMFALSYGLTLDQDLIKDLDIEQFEGYRLGLEDSMRQDNPIQYVSQIQTRKPLQDVDLRKSETHFIDPWKVEIPKINKDD